MKTIRQIYEALRFALQSVIVNKMRTLLSLLGITIGIFAIISVFTVLDAMESYIRSSVNVMGTNIVYVGRWPWTPEDEPGSEGEYQWWKYAARPRVSTTEFNQIREMLPTAKAIAMSVEIYVTMQRDNRSQPSTTVFAVTEEYIQTRKTEIREGGRYFSPSELDGGGRVAIIGSKLAEDFFKPGEDPIGKTIKLNSFKTTVIGVFEKEGENMFGQSYDEQVLIPYSAARSYVNLYWYDKDLIIKGPDNIPASEFKAEIGAAMRRLRKLPPAAENNFALNEVSGMMKQLDEVFATINVVGGVIGLFSILVGGFGVANIMFVSVRERTGQIGIQKALGARPYVILLQFTFEAVLLAVVGGAIGLLFIWAGAAIVSAVFDFTIVLTLKNIMIGLGISSVIGAVSGIFPAYAAATMDPVRAITKS